MSRADHETLTEGLFDVVVIGAGVAGGVAAAVAAAAGLSTLLVDRARWPRDKVCGCCLNDQAVSSLAAAGLSSVVETAGSRAVNTLNLYTVRRDAVIRLPQTRVMGRRELDQALVERAVRRGAVFLPQTRAEVQPLSGPQPSPAAARRAGPGALRRVVLGSTDRQPRVVKARWVVAADGLASVSLRRLAGFQAQVRPGARVGLGTRLPAGVPGLTGSGIQMFVPPLSPGGYVGTVRLADGSLDVAACVDPRLIKQAGGARAALKALWEPIAEGKRAWRPGVSRSDVWGSGVSRSGARLGAIDARAALAGLAACPDLKVVGTPPLTRRRSKVAEPGLLVAGDAAGYIEPFTGEGMAWAATAGLLAAHHVQAAIASGSGPSAADEWPVVLRQAVRRRQRLCWASAALLRRPGWVQTLCAAGPMLSLAFHGVRPKPLGPARLKGVSGSFNAIDPGARSAVTAPQTGVA